MQTRLFNPLLFIAIFTFAGVLACHRGYCDARVAVLAGPGEIAEKLAPLVELRLGRKEGIALLEREKLTQILREQELQALLAADAPGKRAALGQLLKADLLVFLTEREKPKPHVQVVVCETQRGLRLCRESVLSTDKPDTDADAVMQHVERAAAKQHEKIGDICAVPFFVSNDLTYEDDYLKAAYPKLVEETIRGWPGLLTVELEEARAIGREAAIGGDEVRRMVPLYLLGDYRHEGVGDARRGTVRLRIVRGEQELGVRQQADLSADAATQFVRQAAADLLHENLGTHVQPPDAALEARQLARRRRVPPAGQLG